MALINWPNPPALDEEYTHEGRTWKHNGTAWLAATASSGSALTVQDEGSTLSAAVTQINFTGAAVTATGTTSVTVDIPADFYMPIALSDVSTAVTTGTGKEEFTVERAFTLHVIPRFTATTAPTGATFLFDVNKNGTTIFDTRPQIDASGTRSISAGTQAVLTGGSVSYAIGDVIRFDFDQVGSTAAGAGIKAHLFGRWT